MTSNVISLDIDFHIYLFEQSFASPHRQRHRFKWKDVVTTKMYVTQKVYSYSLINTQLELSNLFADCPLVKAWGLPPLGAMVGGKVEKLVGRNRPPPLVMRRQLFYWIAKVMARWQKPKTDKPMATGLDGYTSWRLWVWYTIRCIKARLGRVESRVDENVYLVEDAEHQRCVSGIRYWASNDKSLR